MEVKITARKTITGNSSIESDKLGKIIEAQILFRNPLETIKNNVIREWMLSGGEYHELIFPLNLHTLSCLDLSTEKMPNMMDQVYPVDSISYIFTYEVTSVWYECINTFPNREFLLIDKETDNLISYVAKNGYDVSLLR